MKKRTALLLLTVVLALPGCGANASGTPSALTPETDETTATAESAETETAETHPSAETSAEQVPETAEATTELSYELSTVPYQGETFTKSVFAAGADMLYLYGIKESGAFFLGCMAEEADIFQEFTVPMDGLRAVNMTVDAQGDCHILWMSTEQVTLNGQVFDRISSAKSCITEVNRNGELVQEIDVTEVFAAGYTRPYCFVVDDAGNYYLENRDILIEVQAGGTLGGAVSCGGEIEGVGIGKSGAVYCVYSAENGQSILGRLEGDSIVSCDVTLPDADAMYSGVYPGADAELLLFSKSGSVYAYAEGALQERVSGTALPVTGQDIAGQGVMADGRLCLLEEKDGAQTFYYIPTARTQN